MLQQNTSTYAKRICRWLTCAAGCLLLFPACAQAQTKERPMDAMLHAPDFPKEFAWLNTDQPLSFKGNLKGQVVVLDFWTYCCINCMHILPDLEFLEQKYKDQPVVILGVHSSKYDNESDPANIRAAIQRYEIHHPVLVDVDHKVWDSYDVRSWPTLIVVAADGRIIGGVSGEGHRDLLDQVIVRALRDAKAAGTLAAAPLKLAREGEIRAASGLSFPGKVLVDSGVAGGTKRLFIVDSNHDRIVVTSYPGDDGRVTVLQTIGSGKTGATDGTFAEATFNRPQGATLVSNTLWVADTENHLIRRVDLEKQTVTTVLGTGKQEFDPEAGKSGRQQGLNSPWDVAVAGNRLYVAQAGQHQIFAMNLMTGMTEVAAGSARENIRDGIAKEANLAQPSGLAIDSKNQILYFADSEVSAIRGVDLKNNRVFTVIGHGLFDFGDKDGDSRTARLQHALGVSLSADGSKLLVADTYNHKIKLLDPATRMATTLAGNGKPGSSTMGQPPQFFEPASISVASSTETFVADTNNHRIVRFNPETKAWKELIIDGLSTPDTSAELVVDKDAVEVGRKSFAAGKAVEFKATLKLPRENHLTEGAPLSLKITDGTRVLYSTTLSAPTRRTAVPVVSATIPPEALASKPGQIYTMVYYTHCSEGLSAVCVPAKAAWKFEAGFEGAGSALEVAQ
jgi:thiol-disulfide isomerase/thioredoxin/sugar lactone lactonase YvrE